MALCYSASRRSKKCNPRKKYDRNNRFFYLRSNAFLLAAIEHPYDFLFGKVQWLVSDRMDSYRRVFFDIPADRRVGHQYSGKQ